MDFIAPILRTRKLRLISQAALPRVGLSRLLAACCRYKGLAESDQRLASLETCGLAGISAGLALDFEKVIFFED
jgi:hypothetical protein